MLKKFVVNYTDAVASCFDVLEILAMCVFVVATGALMLIVSPIVLPVMTVKWIVGKFV